MNEISSFIVEFETSCYSMFFNICDDTLSQVEYTGKYLSTMISIVSCDIDLSVYYFCNWFCYF